MKIKKCEIEFMNKKNSILRFKTLNVIMDEF